MSETHTTSGISIQTVLFVLIPEYADWEASLLSAGLRKGFGLWQPRYVTRTVAPTNVPITSIGGFQTMPDYSFATAPEDFAALILVGGTNWFGKDAENVLPLIDNALKRGAVVGAICDASMFLGVHGYLNNVMHTSNSLDMLKKRGAKYTGENLFKVGEPSVRDGNIITANGVGYVEFAQNVFAALDVASPEKISEFYHACKTGRYEF